MNNTSMNDLTSGAELVHIQTQDQLQLEASKVEIEDDENTYVKNKGEEKEK